MNFISRRLGLGLMLLGAAGPAYAQQVAPPNVHFLLDTSGSMRELPQIKNSAHSTFFNNTINGCSNPHLDAVETAAELGSHHRLSGSGCGHGPGLGHGLPEPVPGHKFYAYMGWDDSSSPPYQWDSQEQACQSQVPNWSTTNGAPTTSASRAWRPRATGSCRAPPSGTSRRTMNLDFIFWGRFLNFNPPKYVTAKAVLKRSSRTCSGCARASASSPTPACSPRMLSRRTPRARQILSDSSAFDSNRASYINTVNGVGVHHEHAAGQVAAQRGLLLHLGRQHVPDDVRLRLELQLPDRVQERAAHLGGPQRVLGLPDELGHHHHATVSPAATPSPPPWRPRCAR